MNNKLFGEFIKSRRKKLHLSQSFIANKLGYTTQIVSSWERGLSYPIMSCWNDLMDILQIDINGLLKCEPIYKIKGYKFNDKKFVFNLKDLRLNSGLTQIELAAKLKVNNKTISSWENNASLPSMEDFINLSIIFNVSYADLLYGEHIDEEPLIVPKKVKSKIWFKPLLISMIALLIIGCIAIPIIISSKNIRHESSLFNYNSDNDSVSEIIDDSSSIGSSSSEVMSSSASEYIPPINYSLNILNDDLFLHIGESTDIEYELEPQDAEIVWNSSKPEVVSVDNGVITANKYGESIITATIKNDSSIVDSVKVRCKYESSETHESFLEYDEEAFEFMYPSKKKVARFYFEDRLTVIHEELFETTDDFTYSLPEPVFGPLKGWEYHFKGWDMDGDNKPDELPKNLVKDTDFYAVYEKTPTSEQDFVMFDGYKNCATSIRKEYELYIIPSDLYFNNISPSDIYNDSQEWSLQYNDKVKYLVPMYGFEHIWFGVFFENAISLRYQSTIRSTRNSFQSRITIDGGYVSGGLMLNSFPVFEQGITNKYLKIENQWGDWLSNNCLSECLDIECLMFLGSDYPVWDEGCFRGLNKLKILNTKEVTYTHLQHADYSILNNTSISYFDCRGFDEGGFLSPNSSEITLLVPTLLDNTTIQFDDTKGYNILLGYDNSPLATSSLVGDSMLEKSNLKFYYYSKTQIENGWHFNDYGFPTNVYN